MAPPEVYAEIAFQSLTLGAVLQQRIAQRNAGCNVYARAAVGRRNGEPRTLGRSAPIDGASGVVDLSTQRMAWRHGVPLMSADEVTVSLTVIEDVLDDHPVELAHLTADYSTAIDADLQLQQGDIVVAFTLRAVRGVAPGGGAVALENMNVLNAPAIIRAEITAITGLFRPTGADPAAAQVGTPVAALSASVAGYISEDNLGRVFIDRDPQTGNWTKGEQAIDLTVQLTLAGMQGEPLAQRRNDVKVKWIVYVPDDTSDDDRHVHRSDGALLDPADYAQGVPLGAAGYDNEGGNAKYAQTHVWEEIPGWALTAGAAEDPIGVPAAMQLDPPNTPYRKPAETVTTDLGYDAPSQAYRRESRVRMHCPDVRGDRFILRAVAVDAGGGICVAAQTGIITMWERLNVEYRVMPNAFEIPIAHVPSHFESVFVQMDFVKGAALPGGLDSLPMKDLDAFMLNEFQNRATPGWFCLFAICRLGKQMLPGADLFTGIIPLHDALGVEPLRPGAGGFASARAEKRLEFLDVPMDLEDFLSVHFRWNNTEVRFDQCRVEKFKLEKNRAGIRQRLKLLGYPVGPTTDDDLTVAERGQVAQFRKDNDHLEQRAAQIGEESARNTFRRKWLHWRVMTPGSANDSNPSDQDLEDAAGNTTISRIWITPHEFYNKFTAGDGGYPHAAAAELMFGPRYRETFTNGASAGVLAGGYGVPAQMEVRVRSLGVERKGQSPPQKENDIQYFAGETAIATRHPSYVDNGQPAQNFERDVLIAVVHELTHAFGMPHKCGRWDAAAKREKTCCMNYAPHWMVDPGTDTLIPGTAGKVGDRLCGRHIREVRRVLLRNNVALKARWNL